MPENVKIDCPFCKKCSVNAVFYPSHKTEFTTGYNENIRVSREKYEVIEDCPNCGASKEKIEKALNSGEDYNKPSVNSVIERMRKAGLPTRV